MELLSDIIMVRGKELTVKKICFGHNFEDIAKIRINLLIESHHMSKYLRVVAYIKFKEFLSPKIIFISHITFFVAVI